MQALEMELNILRTVDSPFTVRFIDNFETDSDYYIIQEFCNGGNLEKLNNYLYIYQRLLNGKKKFNFHETRDLAITLIKGLYYLGSKNIMHRDLKPANILIHNG
jgi:serine/threonine protein kinase